MQNLGDKIRVSFYVMIQSLLCSFLGLSMTAAAGEDDPWTTVYQDAYNYSQQTPVARTFNTWFWREDSAASHTFEITDTPGCDRETPCVRLTAHAYPANTQYTNAEMYNNSCYRDKLLPKDQQLSLLKTNVWGKALYARVSALCDLPYPYQSKGDYATPYSRLSSSWTSQSPVKLQSNPYSLSPEDVEAPWKAYRDVVFNNPYQATDKEAVRISMSINAEEPTQGGSRGWGFWNTSLDPEFFQLAWFMEYSAPAAFAKKGSSKTHNREVLMQTIGRSPKKEGYLVYCATKLSQKNHDIYQWQDYQVELRADGVTYRVNGNVVAVHRGIDLTKPMAFHNWVDNRNYNVSSYSNANFHLTKDKSNLIRQYSVESAPIKKLQPLQKQTPHCRTLSPSNILWSLLADLYGGDARHNREAGGSKQRE